MKQFFKFMRVYVGCNLQHIDGLFRLAVLLAIIAVNLYLLTTL
jgi:hypothetical protein